MKGDELAGMKDARMRPTELKGLVDYLDLEELPTAIVRLDHTQDVTYTNPAFERLGAEQSEIQDLRDAIQRTLKKGVGVKGLHGGELDGKRWRARITGEYCIATAIGERLDRTESEDSVQTMLAIDDSAHVKYVSQSLDWITHPPTKPSAWVSFMRNFDWAATALGPMSSWGPELRQYMLHITSNPDPRYLVWGDDMTFIYNEASMDLWGKKHPAIMGTPAREAWSEIWGALQPMFIDVYDGKCIKMARSAMMLERHGWTEETYWDFTLVPIIGPDGRGIGLIDEFTETTPLETSDRRRQIVNSLSERLRAAVTLDSVWTSVLESLGAGVPDIPFGILYTVVDDLPDRSDAASSSVESSTESQSTARPKKCILTGSVGVEDGNPELVSTFPLDEDVEPLSGIVECCLRAMKDGKAIFLSAEDETLPVSLRAAIPDRSFGDKIRNAIVIPIGSATSSDIAGFLIVGLNPRTHFTSDYKIFLHIAVEMIEKAATLISLPEEQRRSQKLADDITSALTQQLRLSNIQAEKNEEKFSRMADSAPIGMFMFEPDGKTIYTNRAYQKLLGVDPHQDSAITSAKTFGPWSDHLHKEDFDLFLDAWKRVTEEKVPITFEYRLKREWSSIDKSTGQNSTGETWLHATAFPEIASDGSVMSVQGWLTDISHRKFSENMLSQRLEDALENKRQTENFIDMTSHEMRNPLSAILQSADSILSTLTSTGIPILNEDMILSAEVAEEIIDAAQVIVLCAQHQKRIVDDILTLSKLDASLLVISPDKVQVPALIKKALKMYEAEIERADIDAQLNIEPTYEELHVDWVILDPSRLLQVVINLLTNAIKFTQYSSLRKIKICVGASYQQPTGKHHGTSFVPQRYNRTAPITATEWGQGEDIYIQIAVYDTGRGLNEDEMKLLFGRFQQASPKTYKQYGGSGLGLFISRELCELQGGQIGVASKDGQTVFTFFVRAKRWDSEDQVPNPIPNGFASASASPVAFNRRGSTVLHSSDDQMEASSPLLDGTTVETFRPKSLSRQSSYASTPTQLTSQQLADELKVLKLTKPAPLATSNTQQLHVLIVEDNTINARVMSQQLRRAGCVVHVANHGLECLDFLEKSTFYPPPAPIAATVSTTDTLSSPQQTPLSIILLDLEMPVMDGLTCIRHIRERQANGKILGHVPVIAVTANARSEQIHFAIEAGMDQVVTKPFRIPELVPQMEGLVGEVRRGAWLGGSGRTNGNGVMT